MSGRNTGDRSTGAESHDSSAANGEGVSGDGDESDRGDQIVGARTSRHERLTVHPTPGAGNSLSHWPEAKSPLRTAINFVVVWFVRYSPSLTLKRWLLRRLGADVGAGVAFALTATPDVFWPELMTVDGYDATILCHEFLQDEYRTGEVHVGERAMIGADAVILPGVTIGADAQVAANSMVTEDVPPGATVAGVPATPVDEE